MFADKEKYKVLEMGTLNGNRVYNGTILFEKPPQTIKAELRHGYTIHSFQGKTVKEGKLFIHSKLGSSKMLYTAMSRASSINQIIFIQ
jgi:ATP-dependent exoDNAse (exonuclease V) alpha subunit